MTTKFRSIDFQVQMRSSFAKKKNIKNRWKNKLTLLWDHLTYWKLLLGPAVQWNAFMWAIFLKVSTLWKIKRALLTFTSWTEITAAWPNPSTSQGGRLAISKTESNSGRPCVENVESCISFRLHDIIACLHGLKNLKLRLKQAVVEVAEHYVIAAFNRAVFLVGAAS